jgi:hypothetical protein
MHSGGMGAGRAAAPLSVDDAVAGWPWDSREPGPAAAKGVADTSFESGDTPTLLLAATRAAGGELRTPQPRLDCHIMGLNSRREGGGAAGSVKH